MPEQAETYYLKKKAQDRLRDVSVCFRASILKGTASLEGHMPIF